MAKMTDPVTRHSGELCAYPRQVATTPDQVGVRGRFIVSLIVGGDLRSHDNRHDREFMDQQSATENLRLPHSLSAHIEGAGLCESV